MEERALYRAILAQPHDDALRLAYADWLDENADALPGPSAERGRAAFIRLQCDRARRYPNGWRAGSPPAAALDARVRRLLFRHGKKWRRAFPVGVSSAPFDRGFLRPFRALTAIQFRNDPLGMSRSWQDREFPSDSPARRYVSPEDGPFAAAPLWDVHLYGPGWLNDSFRDVGQYGPLLADVARNPGLRQVGWLKLSFCRTPVLDFLRAGDFANVETLVLNSGPFPDVLAAVAANASFRSLRYVQFGSDLWAWAPTYPERIRFYALQSRLAVLNDRHLPFGAMRGGVASVLRDTPLVLPPPPPPVNPWPLAPPAAAASALTAEEERHANTVGSTLGALAVVALVTAYAACSKHAPQPTHPQVKIPDYKPLDFKMPEYKPLPKLPMFPPTDPLRSPESKEFQEALKKWRELRAADPAGTLPSWGSPKRLPVAPPPCAAEPKAAPDIPDEK